MVDGAAVPIAKVQDRIDAASGRTWSASPPSPDTSS